MKFKYIGTREQTFPLIGTIKKGQEINTDHPETVKLLLGNDRFFKLIKDKKTKTIKQEQEGDKE